MIWRLSFRGRPPRGFRGSTGSNGPMRSQSVSGTVAKRASMGRAFHQILFTRAKFPDRLLEMEAGYGVWHVEQAVPFNRAGLVASVVVWLIAIGLFLVL